MELSPNTEQSIRDIQEDLKKIKTVMWERVTLTTVEVAFKTGLDERTISKYCRVGAIKAVQPVKGGSYLIPLSELDRILLEADQNERKNQRISTAALRKINT